jgi:hypothetical protein
MTAEELGEDPEEGVTDLTTEDKKKEFAASFKNEIKELVTDDELRRLDSEVHSL